MYLNLVSVKSLPVRSTNFSVASQMLLAVVTVYCWSAFITVTIQSNTLLITETTEWITLTAAAALPLPEEGEIIML